MERIVCGVEWSGVVECGVGRMLGWWVLHL